MKSSTLALAAQLLSSVAAFNLVQRENPRVLNLDIQRRHVINPVARDRLRRRQKTVQETLDNLETLYFANASLGTPEQKLRLHIDTGSSDLWANAASSQLCSSRGSQCADSGTYDANSSSTYEFVNSAFNISYVDGSGAAGDYAKDTLHFGGQEIKGMQFGIGYVSSSPEGILGIGYTINEVQVNRAGLKAYPNLPQLLADNGNINTNAYSLWLNDLDASTGSILFGGVDTEKYTGQLSKLPIIREQGVYAEFIIALTSMGMNGKAGSLFNNDTVPVLLDSGSSLMYLPDNLVRSLYSQFSAQYDSTQGAAFVDCGLADQNGSLDFSFSGVTISVPMNELVIVAGYQRGKPVCILGIGPAGDSTCVLGDTFLRSAYVVYDLENNQIALAQTNFNATKTSIQEIQSGSNGVPDASGVANAVSSVAVGTGGARNGGPQISATGAGAQSTGAAMPVATPHPWLGAGAVVAGAGLLMGFNGL
ncbi:candidapepsin-4 precursor [Lindgomyces ingoldianus]|uniref:Candidapepsin-4 n=1 Tax=Lindgomyces ingoldianus TaxID=673940 RepID=A0ACB6QWB1_9PLEO|nr:candidapepsin-4 precursor [Lindgomyces ingoldianus]KAF2471309.1 candidapepsin-4 precursor [Lindgomyces ingoldianus]